MQASTLATFRHTLASSALARVTLAMSVKVVTMGKEAEPLSPALSTVSRASLSLFLEAAAGTNASKGMLS